MGPYRTPATGAGKKLTFFRPWMMLALSVGGTWWALYAVFPEKTLRITIGLAILVGVVSGICILLMLLHATWWDKWPWEKHNDIDDAF